MAQNAHAQLVNLEEYRRRRKGIGTSTSTTTFPWKGVVIWWVPVLIW